MPNTVEWRVVVEFRKQRPLSVAKSQNLIVIVSVVALIPLAFSYCQRFLPSDHWPGIFLPFALFRFSFSSSSPPIFPTFRELLLDHQHFSPFHVIQTLERSRSVLVFRELLSAMVFFRSVSALSKLRSRLVSSILILHSALEFGICFFFSFSVFTSVLGLIMFCGVELWDWNFLISFIFGACLWIGFAADPISLVFFIWIFIFCGDFYVTGATV